MVRLPASAPPALRPGLAVANGEGGKPDATGTGATGTDATGATGGGGAGGGNHAGIVGGASGSTALMSGASAFRRICGGGATGGGVSNVFAKPAYQASINVPAPAKSTGGRGVPDVSGNADPDTGYEIVLDGKAAVIGGTSAVAPLWASLVALLNQQRANQAKQPVGFLNPLLYGTAASANAFHDVSTGNNDVYGDLQGKYPSGKGWDACTGLGTPDGTALSTAL